MFGAEGGKRHAPAVAMTDQSIGREWRPPPPQAILVACFTTSSSRRSTVATFLEQLERMPRLGNTANQALVLSSETTWPRSPDWIIRRHLQSVSAAAPAETLFCVLAALRLLNYAYNIMVPRDIPMRGRGEGA